jgi:hypothetical protein
MHKRRAGLQKEISKIFTGIHIPRQDASEADTHPAAPAPAKYIPPKPIAPAPTPAPTPAPRPFTIPEPTQQPPPAPKQAAYSPPAPKQVIYEPPKQTIYESPALAPIVRQHQPELLPKPSRQIPLLKTLKRIKARLLDSKPGGDSRRQKIMILVMPVLFVVFVAVLTHVLRTPASTEPKPNSAPSGTAVAFSGKIDWEPPPPYPETIRDPMVFGAVTQNQEDTGGLVVKGIVYSEDNPIAVVGDRIVSVGDVVQGATVLKINPNSVEFAIGDKKWTQKVER